MKKIDKRSRVELFLQASWRSSRAKHTDCYQADSVNIWRDTLPAQLKEALIAKESGDTIDIRLNAGDAVPEYQARNLMQIQRSQIRKKTIGSRLLVPHAGRFYPKGVLKDITGIFRENVEPFRVVAVNNGNLNADLNHPMAQKSISLKATIGKIDDKNAERGGSSVDWLGLLLDGPGMQARWMDKQTDFFVEDPYTRDDDLPDSAFYGQPRWVQHLDDTALQMVTNTYGRFLQNDMKVLDLMSSWQSHLPLDVLPAEVTGVGLNEAELKRNAQLTGFLVHDLNIDPLLPMGADHYDVALCTVSIEYLVNPLTVFKEVARLLKPGGFFIVTFSNRWFPTKAVRIWKEIHAFERMGLVLEYFIRSEKFRNLQTYSIRGLPRPRHDKYFPEQRASDPVFAVWGQKI
jgi:SAM-dependent methyltransferase/FKBP-type peptidyl-prolyl cis-trans isomerase 2